jgi:hypothetical protein
MGFGWENGDGRKNERLLRSVLNVSKRGENTEAICYFGIDVHGPFRGVSGWKNGRGCLKRLNLESMPKFAAKLQPADESRRQWTRSWRRIRPSWPKICYRRRASKDKPKPKHSLLRWRRRVTGW